MGISNFVPTINEGNNNYKSKLYLLKIKFWGVVSGRKISRRG